jgi:outer membrane protein assembly factor BamB
VTRRTTICCSALALLALAKPPGPIPLLPLRTVWTLALNNHLTVPPAVDATHGYFPIEHDRLVAYDLVSGKQLWLVEARPIFKPAATDNLVFVTETTALTALRASDGGVAWRYPLPEPLTVRPGTSSGWIVMVTKAGNVLAVHAADGHLAWQRDVGSPPHASPGLGGGRVYVPTAGGQIVALNLENGEPAWEHRVGGLPGEILARENRVFAGSTDHFLYCLLANDGRIDWRWRMNATDIIDAPVADGQRVYFVALDNVLRSLNQTSGGQYWMRALPFRAISAPLLAGGTLLVAGKESPTIKAFNAKDGAPAPDIAAGENVAVGPEVPQEPPTGLTTLVVVTRNIVRGDTVTMSVHTFEPVPTPLAPLPTVVTPAQMQEKPP